jgi:hypothetical protein
MERNQMKPTMLNEFTVLLGTAAMASVLDIESTKYAQHDPEAAEVNSWIYGERPSRSRMYAVSVPMTVALAAWAGYLKSSSSADAKNGWAWRLPLLGLTLGHSAAAAANFLNFRKDHPRKVSE